MPSLLVDRVPDMTNGSTHLYIYASLLLVVPLLISLGSIVYNLYFHPLSKYPGPFLARATGFWYAYHLWNGSQAVASKKAHEKYGDIVRLSPRDLDYTVPQAWRDIFGHRMGVPENSKDSRGIVRDNAPAPSIINANREHHSQLRRLLAHGFSDKALRDQQPIIKYYVDLLVQRLHQQCDKGENVVNMLDWYNFTTFDVIGHLAFSEPFNCLSESDYHPWVKMMFHTLQTLSLFVSVQRIGIFENFLKRHFVPTTIKATRLENFRLIHEMLMRRLDKKPEFTDMMENMIAAKEKGQLDVNSLTVNSRLLIAAGSETTATLLTGATYFLLKNPAAMQRLKHEVRSRFASDDAIDFAGVNELPFLLAVLDESLRLFPPVAGSLVRVTPPEGAQICGEWVPGNTSVGITHLAINYSEKNFAEPEEFRPERFLHGAAGHRDMVSGIKGAEKEKVGGEEEEEGAGRWNGDRREALQPFSFGPRNCIGRNLAYIEMRLILAKLIWNFDFEEAEGNGDPTQGRVFLIWEKGPLKVKLTPVAR